MQASAILVLLLSFCTIAAGFHQHKNSGNGTGFIVASCKVTTHQSLCVDSLSPYASQIQDSPLQLARAALSVGLAAAESASAAMAKLAAEGEVLTPREAAAVSDCRVTTQDSVDQLKRSLDAMEATGRGLTVLLNKVDVQTWVSAALTDEYTCMKGLDEGGKVPGGSAKSDARRQISNAGKLISNALALVCALDFY